MEYDRIYIRDLLLRAVIGVYDEERREKQDIIINVTMWADLRKPGLSDDLADSVDYKQVKKKIIEMVSKSDSKLIEHLAQRIADTCLDNEKVRKVQVCIDKPGALRFARSVAVEIIRSRDDRA